MFSLELMLRFSFHMLFGSLLDSFSHMDCTALATVSQCPARYCRRSSDTRWAHCPRQRPWPRLRGPIVLDIFSHPRSSGIGMFSEISSNTIVTIVHPSISSNQIFSFCYLNISDVAGQITSSVTQFLYCNSGFSSLAQLAGWVPTLRFNTSRAHQPRAWALHAPRFPVGHGG